MSTYLYRLVPSLNVGWEFYPAFEERVKKFNHQYLQEYTSAQEAFMVQTLRQRFVNDPLSSGYWIAIKDSNVIGHVCGWMAMDWGQPYAFIYQAETSFDEGLSRRWVMELGDWISEMNGALMAQGKPQITFAECATFHKPDAFNRLLGMWGAKNLRTRSLIRFDVEGEI